MKVVLSHFTQHPFRFESEREYPTSENEMGGFKPNGLWLSDEGDLGWKRWCELEKWGTHTLRFETKFLCDTSKWLVLRSTEELWAFTKREVAKLPDAPSGTGLIDWPRVQGAFSGILITPYNWDMRHSSKASWYYTWDCASACVWDLSTIQPLKNVQTNRGKADARISRNL